MAWQPKIGPDGQQIGWIDSELGIEAPYQVDEGVGAYAPPEIFNVGIPGVSVGPGEGFTHEGVDRTSINTLFQGKTPEQWVQETGATFGGVGQGGMTADGRKIFSANIGNKVYMLPEDVARGIPGATEFVMQPDGKDPLGNFVLGLVMAAATGGALTGFSGALPNGLTTTLSNLGSGAGTASGAAGSGPGGFSWSSPQNWLAGEAGGVFEGAGSNLAGSTASPSWLTGSGGYPSLGEQFLSGSLSGGLEGPAAGSSLLNASGGATPYSWLVQSGVPAATAQTIAGQVANGSISLSDLAKFAGPIASVAGGVMGAGAAKDAAQTQSEAADRALALQSSQFNQTQENLRPYMAAGTAALDPLRYGLGIGGSPMNTGVGQGQLTKPFTLADFKESPAYQFNLQEGEKALMNAARKSGKAYAPATLQDIGKYSQGVASNEFQNAFNNFRTTQSDIYGRLSGTAGAGQNAAANLGTNATNFAGNAGNLITSQGAAQAAGGVGAANALSGGLSNAYNAYLLNQILSQNQQSSY